MKEKLMKVSTAIISVATLMVSRVASASGETGQDLATEVVGVLQGTATSIKGVLTGIAPVALGIVGVFLAWKYGMKFFKSLSK